MLNKKGITPIIAIVLLLMITVAVAGTVSFWLTSVQRGAQSEIEDATGIITEQTQQTITIEFRTCDATNDEVIAVIRNGGTRRIDSGEAVLVVKNEDGSQDLAHSTYSMSSIDRDLTEEATWDSFTPGTFDITADTVYQLVVTVPGGANDEITCLAQ
jgi:flagellin-like protein